MRNIEFKEDQGPGFWRRLLAFLVIVACLLAAAAYQYFFVSAEYRTSLTLLARDPAACDRLIADTLRDRDRLLQRMNGEYAPHSAAAGVLQLDLDELPQAEDAPPVISIGRKGGAGTTGEAGEHDPSAVQGKAEAKREEANAGGVAETHGSERGRISRFLHALVSERKWYEAALLGLSVEKKADGLVQILCTETASAYQETELAGTKTLETVLRGLEQTALDADLQQVQEQKSRLTRRQQELALEANGLQAQFALKQEVAQALRELGAAGAGKDWPGGSWQEAFPKTGEAARIVTALEKQLEQARELSRQIARDRELSASVERWVHAPENQNVTRRTKRVVYHEDTPELIRVRDLKAELEAQRMRLLQRATTRHPLAMKLSAQIEELQSQIEALTRLPEVVEDVVEETNPEMNSWQKQLADAAAAIHGAEAKLTLVRQNILALAAQLQTAEERQRQQQLQNEKLRVQSQIKALAENAPVTGGLPFAVYVPAGRPQAVHRPAAWPVYGGALACGLACAVLLLITRRKTRFGVLEKPEEVLPEYPVLGSIPRFDSKEESGRVRGAPDTKRVSA